MRFLRTLISLAFVVFGVAVLVLALGAYLTATGRSVPVMRMAAAKAGDLLAGQTIEQMTLSLSVEPSRSRIDGVAQLRIRADVPRQRLYLLLNDGLVIHRVWRQLPEGRRQILRHTRMWLLAGIDLDHALAPGEEATLVISYGGDPLAGLSPFGLRVMEADEVILSSSALWYPTDARSFIHADVEVTLPASLAPVHNGTKVAVANLGNSRRTRWSMERPVPGLALVAGHHRHHERNEAGVSFQLHTRLAAAATEDGRLRYAVTESKSGRQAWSGKIFIDTTGDGDLGALAGNGYDFAHEGTGLFQPSSLNCLVAGLDSDELAGIDRWAMRKELERAGVALSYGVMGASLFYVGAGLYFLQATHQYGYRVFDSAREQTRATVQGRVENHRMVRALRELGGKWRNIVMVATAEQIGNREGRRLHGLATVTRDDLMEGREQPDPAVSGVTYSMNIHPVKLEGNPAEIEKMRSRVKPYDIPFRALVAKDVVGLLMAGRCISGDFFAHGSYRVTGYAVPMGETAGVAAALAAQTGALPHELSWETISDRRREVREGHLQGR